MKYQKDDYSVLYTVAWPDELQILSTVSAHTVQVIRVGVDTQATAMCNY